ncbi:AfsR/SARP family transcriptional regulator, partial [Streptomyces sp. 4N509B]|uniref:AfsR/SARP family transcriptional regulator n=1 Tax=Streptomyces sp. 4N509B TaxID=3457413 RepID=UPI003FD505C1
MKFVVLGPVAVRRDGTGGREVVTGRLRRVLLGILLARANEAVSIDTLTEALWGERVDERAGQRLHLHVYRLRSLLGEPDQLTWGPEGYRLRVAPGELDAERFESLVGEGVDLVTRDPARAVTVLREALALWRGRPFGDVDVDVPLLADWSQRLGERRVAALEGLYEAELASGSPRLAAGELAGLVREFPLRERLHGLLMVALYRSGRREEALGAYRVARG